MSPRSPINVAILYGFAILALIYPASHVSAQSTSQPQTQTSSQSESDQQLEAEIAQLQIQLDAASNQAQTLQSAIQALNLNVKKITTSITLTNNEIIQANAEIKNLSNSIATTTVGMTQATSAVATSLRELNELDAQPLFVTLLANGTLSSFFDEMESLSVVQASLQQKTQELSYVKTGLENNKSAVEAQRATLAALQQNLNEQRQGLIIARASQTELLQQTKDQESNYAAIIAQKRAGESQFEQSLLAYEKQLDLKMQSSSVPTPGIGILQWPLDPSSIKITQYFGNTPFATQNPAVYNGHGHDGVDLRASPGTPVMAARQGVVIGTGNTDLTCPGASYGKWIFIEHDNGLSTIYAHLATILVSKGDRVTTGQVIAYSDTTGYAIGPHLHFGVYATAGSEVGSWPTTNPNCKGKIYTMPVASLSAYLNPLSYLPLAPK
jgi:murein DD-endopeptidase MepM/ murein hydrolase activator NlpD